MKPLADVCKPDDRSLHFATLEERHSILEKIVLHKSVPEHVRELFNTAKNLSLYTWYAYEFHPIAILTGFLALESAVKTRAVQESPKFEAIRSFRKLMEIAQEKGWITEERIGHRHDIARVRVMDRKIKEAMSHMSRDGMKSIPVEEPTEEEIQQEETDMQVIALICSAGVSIRNSLAHGERMLTPGSESQLRMTADLINQLFT